MKAKTKHTAMLMTIFVLLLIILYKLTQPQPVKRIHTRERVHVPVQIPVTREFRAPPIKEYKPRRVQQMGVLLGENNETLPLYGKEVRGRRDRYHYYTVTPGDQMYSLPVSMGERDCMDDIGCRLLLEKKTVNILGQSGDFAAKLYRTDNFF